MGNPGFAKVVLWLALLAGGAFFGVRYLHQHPHAADIQKTNPGVYQPQGGQPGNPAGGNGGSNVVVIP